MHRRGLFAGEILVFANVTLPQDEYAFFRDLYGIMYNDLPRPELVVYLHLDMDRVRERIRARGRSYEQQYPIDYLANYRTATWITSRSSRKTRYWSWIWRTMT